MCHVDGASVDCVECTGNCICFPPFDPPVPIDISCEPFFPFAVAVATKAAAPALTAFVRLPIVNDPAEWRNVGLNVGQPHTPLSMPTIGWHLVFVRVIGGPAPAIVSPATVPTTTPDLADKVISASVVLPEAGGYNQYWVPVTEQTRFAQLNTAEWTVFFIRDALPN